MRIALIHNNPKSPWINVDRSILSSVGEVESIYISDFFQVFGLLFRLFKYDLLYFWFGSFNFLIPALVARLLSKKIVFIAGGYDVSRLDEIKYGAFSKTWPLKVLRQFLFRLADQVIGVSASNLKEVKENLKLKNEAVYCHLAFERRNLVLKTFSERDDQIIMVSNLDSEQMFQIKGAMFFLELARLLPHYKFVFVGRVDQSVKQNHFSKLPPNFWLAGEFGYSSEAFSELLNSSKMIFQHSMIESFGAAVVDGALMGCLPIVSDRFSLPEVVGEKGIVIQYGNLDKLMEVVSKYMESEMIKPHELSTYFSERYSLTKREEKIHQIIRAL